ncbi:MAG: ATP-binding protein [Rhodocyclales bacterium]|nr:ATP-binding protein [Rhodocyclales bacterium]
MHRLLDVLASGVHDAKNQLFYAEAQIAAAEAAHGLDLAEARYAIEAAAGRLSRTLAAYRLLRDEARLAVVPAVVADLCEEVALDQRKHLARAGLTLDVACTVRDEWALDRDLVADILNNAIQNASRHARSRIRLSAGEADGSLCLRVEDDGCGFADTDPAAHGIGLLVAARIAELHRRQERHGSLRLCNGGEFGGAVLELRLP